MRICLVDDLIPMRKALRRVLQTLPGAEIIDFGGAPETIAYLEGHYVDLVIADIYLEKGSGFDVLRYIRARPVAPDTPVIFVTGGGTKDDVVYSSELGVSGYILKPFEASELLAKVEQVFERFQNPSRVEKLLNKAAEAFISGDPDEARALYLAAADRGGQLSARAAVGVARIDLLRGHSEQAWKRLQTTVEAFPLFFPAFALLADTALERGCPERAVDYLKKELEINGRQPHRRMLLAELLLEAGRETDALAQMRQAIIDAPRDERLLIKMAEIFTALGDRDKALHYYLKTRRLARNSREALQGILDLCVSGRETRKCYQLLTDQLLTDRSRYEVYLYRAKLHEYEGELEKALGDVDAYLVSSGDDREVLRYKAKLLGRQKKHLEQGQVFAQLCALQSGSDFEAKAGLAFLKAGAYKEAIRHYTKAVKREPDNAKYRFNLAFALEQSGQFDKARSMLHTLLKANPDHVEAQEFLDRLQAG